MSETINSVSRALDILLLMYNNREELGISEISRELDLHKSTIHRTLKTLEEKGFVYKNIENDKYWLGIKIYAMGLFIGEKMSINDLIKPFAKTLFDEFNEVVNVSILDANMDNGYKGLIILKESKIDKVLSVNPNIGSSSDAHSSSVGKCLLAFSKNIDLDIYSKVKLKKHTPNTIDNVDDLKKELVGVREKGYAIDNEEQEVGLYCIGAPIFGKNNNAIAAISMSGPTARMKNEDLNNKIKRLVEIANEISVVTAQMK